MKRPFSFPSFTKSRTIECRRTVWRTRVVLHTRIMTKNQSSFQPFNELSPQAKTLLFIYASAAWARFDPRIPAPSVLLAFIETVWSAQQLGCDAVSDPDRMTRLLEKHLDLLCSAAASRRSMSKKTA